MKTSAILCAVLAGTFGFGSVASAQGHDGDRRGDRGDRGQRWEQRQDRHERRDARHEARQERREDRREDRRVDRAYDRGYHAGAWQQPRHVAPQPSYNHGYRDRTPNYSYGHRDSSPGYRTARFHRGTYLPAQYRAHPYYVNDWHSHQGLYAPPYGHQWVNVDGEFLLVALATGLIASAILN